VGRLFLRIFLWFWLGSSALVAGVVIGFWLVQPDVLTAFRTITETAMLHIGTQAANAFEETGEPGATAQMKDISSEIGSRVWLYAPDGSLLAGPAETVEVRDLVTQTIANMEIEHPGRLRQIVFANRIASAAGREYFIVWESPLRLSQIASQGVLWIRGVVLALIGGLACSWLTWQITKPIRILRTTASRFAQGDLTTRIGSHPEFRRGDELAELARDFDYMASRIEQLVKSQQQLLADISHELRSPLARLSLALDLARRRVGDGIPEHQRMEREIDRLNELIEQLLTVARLKEQSREPELECVNVRELVNEVAADANFEAEAAGRKVVVARAIDASVRGSRVLLRSAIENVVRNAIRYTREGTDVTIEMERINEGNDAQRLRIAVRDHGPGVPAPAIERLFDPFFRVEEGRDRKSGGVGLGLAITRQAMLTYGGTASAENQPGGGLLIRLELPIT
jgi:two-component system, OmpR family, sensor histidine kinase CpxA